jgi:hypothetical protein
MPEEEEEEEEEGQYSVTSQVVSHRWNLNLRPKM